jgi:cyclase
MCKSVRTPVIASGGCGNAKHMLEVFEKTDVDAALAASIFHYEKSTIDKVKRYLKRHDIKIRL